MENPPPPNQTPNQPDQTLVRSEEAHRGTIRMSTALWRTSLNLWAIVCRSSRCCMVPGCLRRTYGPFCCQCATEQILTVPPLGWMNLFVRSKVYLGTYSVILQFLPKVLTNIVHSYVHGMCKYDRLFLIHLQIKHFVYLE